MSTKLNITVLASDYISQFWGRVVFDYSTLKFPERAALDYDHWDDEIIGYIENFKATDEAVTADAVLLDESPSDRATEVAYNIANGVPYEASALIDLESATETEVLNNAVETVNGRELRGPFTLYRGATLRGVAVCPHGADAKTRTSLALSTSTKGKLMALKTELNGDAVKLSADGRDVPADGSRCRAECEDQRPLDAGAETNASRPTDGGNTDASGSSQPSPATSRATDENTDVGESADPASVEVVGEVVDVPEPEDVVKLSEGRQPRSLGADFDAMIAEFGLERGVEYYREGYSLDEARLDDYAKLKAAKKDDSELVALRNEVKELKEKLAQFSAPRRGDPDGVAEIAARKQEQQADALQALAAKYKKNGVVRLS